MIVFLKANYGVTIGSPIHLLAMVFPYAMVAYMSISIYQKTNFLFGIIIFILGICPLYIISCNGVKAYDEAINIHASTAAALTAGFILVQSTAVLIILFAPAKTSTSKCLLNECCKPILVFKRLKCSD